MHGHGPVDHAALCFRGSPLGSPLQAAAALASSRLPLRCCAMRVEVYFTDPEGRPLEDL